MSVGTGAKAQVAAPAAEVLAERAPAERAPAAERLDRARRLAGAVPDPEIPVVTLADLGILREVRAEDGRIVVVLTPTYVGCPATEAIRDEVRRVLADAGLADARVEISLSPPWTTDWIGAEARERLRAYGIAPPHAAATDDAAPVRLFRPQPAGIACPRCGSLDTERLAAFGSTPCKALHRCRACREPFDYFKPY